MGLHPNSTDSPRTKRISNIRKFRSEQSEIKKAKKNLFEPIQIKEKVNSHANLYQPKERYHSFGKKQNEKAGVLSCCL